MHHQSVFLSLSTTRPLYTTTPSRLDVTSLFTQVPLDHPLKVVEQRILFMEDLEEKAIHSAPSPLTLWICYIKGSFVIWQHGEDQLLSITDTYTSSAPAYSSRWRGKRKVGSHSCRSWLTPTRILRSNKEKRLLVARGQTARPAQCLVFSAPKG